MIFPANSQEIARRLDAYLPLFARPLLGRLIERVQFETQEEIALAQEHRRQEAGEITPQITARAAAMAAAWATGHAAAPWPGEPMSPAAEALAVKIAQAAAEATARQIDEIRRQEEIAMAQEARRREEASRQAEPRTYTRTYVFEPITQNVLGEAGQDVRIVTPDEQAGLLFASATAGGLEERIRISAAGLEEIRQQFGPYFDRIVDVDAWTAAVRRGEDPSPYMLPAEPALASSADVDTDRILFITQHLAGPHPDPADLEDQQRAREELIQAAEQAD